MFFVDVLCMMLDGELRLAVRVNPVASGAVTSLKLRTDMQSTVVATVVSVSRET